MTTSKGALVLFSGGQDSATCLAWALSRYGQVETIAFDYGQRHAVELAVRVPLLQALPTLQPEWALRLGADHLIDLSLLTEIAETAMTHEMEITTLANGLPNTFVPGRNLLFLTVAATVAYRRGLDVLVGGMSEADYSGYPDCRADTLESLERTLTLGMGQSFTLATPLMQRDKAATWALAQELGGATLVELIRTQTHTCYLGERDVLHDWGYGCGHCPACVLRARGHAAFVAQQRDK